MRYDLKLCDFKLFLMIKILKVVFCCCEFFYVLCKFFLHSVFISAIELTI